VRQVADSSFDDDAEIELSDIVVDSIRPARGLFSQPAISSLNVARAIKRAAKDPRRYFNLLIPNS